MPDTLAERRAYQRLERALLKAGGIEPDDGERCRECGCSELVACPGGCWWAEPDLCNRCAEDLAKRERAADSQGEAAA